MRAKTIVLFTLIVAGAAGAGLFVRNNMTTPEAAEPAPTVEQKPLTHVLVAGDDLSTGTFLDPDKIDWQQWPEDAVAAHHVTRKPDAFAEFDGAVVRMPLAAGDPITRAKVVRPGDRGFLAAVLAPGTRAVSVPVDAVTGTAGLIYPGDRVDLILTQDIDDQDLAPGRRLAGETILADVRVIAVDQRLEGASNGVTERSVARTVTLEVTPAQAETVAVARDLGSLALALRALAEEDARTDAGDTQQQARRPTYAGDISRALDNGAGGNTGNLLLYRGSETSERPR